MELFLSSLEYTDFQQSRNILKYENLVLDNVNVLSIETDIPLIGQHYGFGDKDINHFYLINRFDSEAFLKMKAFPMYVYVLIGRSKEMNRPSSLSDIRNIAWATLYDNEYKSIHYIID